MTALVPEWDWWDEPLPANTSFGEGVELYSGFAFAHYHSRRPSGLTIGPATGVYSWTMFELGPNAELEIGAYCSLVGCIINANSRVVIGDYALIANEVMIADDPAAVPPVSGDAHPQPPPQTITIGENVWIGQRATILSGADIGDGAIIGARTVVAFPVPAYSIVAGTPARVVGTARPRNAS